ncbi:hypothetical protein H6P81_007636 [Aristolochia fimbriata]|uniref:Uncharacterized protein n=1 Tax=Aristolochia fimbriata TaxID=158543 RepID=A0AAV7F0Y6_ARIFI|nr:hypothetical protein H6P81_007636 [Aristolochia fimbriata]
MSKHPSRGGRVGWGSRSSRAVNKFKEKVTLRKVACTVREEGYRVRSRSVTQTRSYCASSEESHERGQRQSARVRDRSRAISFPISGPQARPDRCVTRESG